jgi:biopolymer transport protein ExbD
MRRYSQRAGLSTLTELNITPLLDLAFVLLIIFMITTPLIENRVDLVVPTSSTAKTPVNPGEVQTIEMDRNEVVKLNKEVVSLADLESRLLALKLSDPDVAVVVRPDRDLAIQKFIGVMDVLKRVGIGKVGVMARPEDQQGASAN